MVFLMSQSKEAALADEWGSHQSISSSLRIPPAFQAGRRYRKNKREKDEQKLIPQRKARLSNASCLGMLSAKLLTIEASPT
jgi:hypothetical protein